MIRSTHAELADVIRECLRVYPDDESIRAQLFEMQRRLTEPMRIAVAGIVKSGKSTLINALLGRELALTGAGECTTSVTWYQHGDEPRVMVYPIEGFAWPAPFETETGRLSVDLGDTRPAEIKRIVVDWPIERLRHMTIIDTPGIASLSEQLSERTTELLTPNDGIGEVDAVVYVLRRLHSSDLGFLRAFHDSVTGRAQTVNTVAVLGRADEVGGGRVDSLVSARAIAERYRREHELSELALDVIPVAGLVAQSAASISNTEFAALRTLAAEERAARERMLISADRFLDDDSVPLDRETRVRILRRWGLFGLRLACVLIRAGAADAATLGQQLTRQGGAESVVDAIDKNFAQRAKALTARSVFARVNSIVHAHRREGSERIVTKLEKIECSWHEPHELALVAEIRSGVEWSPAHTEAAHRFVGGAGAAPHDRLGIRTAADTNTITARAQQARDEWRALAANPFLDRRQVTAAHVVERSLDALLADARSERTHPNVKLTLATEPGP